MDRVVGNSFRCGWRVLRQMPVDRFGFPFVDVKRGTWHYRMAASQFDHMPDEHFAEFMTHAYRESMFDQVQQDLDVLARYLLGQREGYGGRLEYVNVPYHEVMDALARYEATKKDMQA